MVVARMGVGVDGRATGDVQPRTWGLHAPGCLEEAEGGVQVLAWATAGQWWPLRVTNRDEPFLRELRVVVWRQGGSQPGTRFAITKAERAGFHHAGGRAGQRPGRGERREGKEVGRERSQYQGAVWFPLIP